MVDMMEKIETYERTQRLPNDYWAIADEILIDLNRRSVTSRKHVSRHDRGMILNWARSIAAGLQIQVGIVNLYDLCNRIVTIIDHETIGNRSLGLTMDDYPRVREWLIYQMGSAQINKN